MKKIFISQPMNGKTDDEILTERQEIIEMAKEDLGEIEVIDSFFIGAPHDAKPLWFLGKSFELLADADVAYFADGWQLARGCKLEHDACIAYGIGIVYANSRNIYSDCLTNVVG